jgi:hypothetical protein
MELQINDVAGWEVGVRLAGSMSSGLVTWLLLGCHCCVHSMGLVERMVGLCQSIVC